MNRTSINLIFIKKRRMELRLTLQEMAEYMDFKNASTYMKYEKGEYAFKADQLPALAKKLHCNLGDFFTNEFADLANAGQPDETSATKETA